MSEEKRGFLTLEEVPKLCDEQAIAAFFSPFMSSTSRAILSDALRQAPCVLVENVPMDVGEMFVKKLKSLGVNVTLCRANGDTRRLYIENR